MGNSSVSIGIIALDNAGTQYFLKANQTVISAMNDKLYKKMITHMGYRGKYKAFRSI